MLSSGGLVVESRRPRSAAPQDLGLTRCFHPRDRHATPDCASSVRATSGPPTGFKTYYTVPAPVVGAVLTIRFTAHGYQPSWGLHFRVAVLRSNGRQSVHFRCAEGAFLEEIRL